jgi:hypothetical protein
LIPYFTGNLLSGDVALKFKNELRNLFRRKARTFTTSEINITAEERE